MSHEEIKTGLLSKGISIQLVAQTLDLLTRCESAQFGVSVQAAEVEKDQKLALDLMDAIRKD